MRKFAPLLIWAFVMPALALGSTANGQEARGAEQKPFIAASVDDLLDAVQACEANKSDQSFDVEGIRKLGWQSLSPPGVMPSDRTMFGKKSSGASITIAPSDAGPDRGCIVIGWVEDKAVSLSARDRIAQKLALTLQVEGDSQAAARANGWAYTFLAFTKPQVTDQTRVVIVITSVNGDQDPEGN